MERLIFDLLGQLHEQILEEVVSPAEDKRSEFHYGRVHGILFAVKWIEQQLRDQMETQARLQDQREREF